MAKKYVIKADRIVIADASNEAIGRVKARELSATFKLTTLYEVDGKKETVIQAYEGQKEVI